jgi:type II secretion system protein N
MVDLRDVLDPEFWRAHATEAGYAGAAVALFLIFLIATFPYSDAVSGVLAPAGLALKSADQHVSFPFGAELDDVRLVSLESPGTPLLQSDRIKVTPALGSLLIFHPGVNAAADIAGGVVRVSARRSGDGTHVSFDMSDLNLAQNRGLAAIGASLAGLLSGSGDITLASDDSGGQSGDFSLKAAPMALRVGPGMPAINFGTVNANLQLMGSVLSLRELKSSGGDLVLNGRGTIRPAANWRQSPIALTVGIDVSPDAQSRLQFLTAMLPYPPGGQPYQIGGTLGSPVFMGGGRVPSAAPRIESASAAPAVNDRASRLEQWRARMEQRRAERGDQRGGFGRSRAGHQPRSRFAGGRPFTVPAVPAPVSPQVTSGDNSNSNDSSAQQDKDDDDSDSSDKSDNSDDDN